MHGGDARNSAAYGPVRAPNPIQSATTTEPKGMQRVSPLIRCPEHADEMTLDEAWDLAESLLDRINRAEQRSGLDAYVTSRDILDELAHIRTHTGTLISLVQRH